MAALRKVDEDAPTMLEQVGDGLYWGSIYWMNGQPSKKTDARSEVNSGVPHLGWGRCFLIDKDPKSKLVTLFCPFTFEGFQVSRDSFEYTSMTPDTQWDPEAKGLRLRPFNRHWHAKNMYAKWEEAQVKRWQRDFDTAVVVFRMLDLKVPTGVPEGIQQKVSGGKEADVLGLLKPVKRTARTGQILAYFWPETRTIREAMAEFAMSRSNVLSQLYLLNKNHGIAYQLKGDQAIVTMPDGCDNPWAEAA